MHPFTAELIGTAILILFGNGVVANVLLRQTKGNNGGWIVIAAGWGLAVFIGAFCADSFSGAHLNPAVTIAVFTTTDDLTAGEAAYYISAQMLGAMLGSLLAYLHYREHFKVTDDPDAVLGCFCTSPAIRKFGQAFFCEVVGTFALILPILLMATPSLIQSGKPADNDPVLGLGSLGLLPVGLLVFGIGLSLGGPTGYAINPVRDLGPRIMHALLPIRGKRDSDWSYAWIPVLGPIAGALLAAAVFLVIVETT